MEPFNQYAQEFNRRTFLSRASMGLGTAALHALGGPSLLRASSGQSPNAPGVAGFPDLPVK
ncbi:MAG: sulfatase, partial [Verrucomicrobia bacterium]|nr:sulfatase [Verrucomicrobiota bacterium]